MTQFQKSLAAFGAASVLSIGGIAAISGTEQSPSISEEIVGKASVEPTVTPIISATPALEPTPEILPEERYQAALAIIQPEIVQEIGMARAKKLKDIIDNNELEIVYLKNGLPTEAPKKIRMIREEIRSLPPAQRRKAKEIWQKIKLAKRGVIKNDEGYWLVNPDGTLVAPQENSEDPFSEE